MRAFVLLAFLLSGSAQAAETVTYVYDARGRLVQVVRTGTVNNGVRTGLLNIAMTRLANC